MLFATGMTISKLIKYIRPAQLIQSHFSNSAWAKHKMRGLGLGALVTHSCREKNKHMVSNRNCYHSRGDTQISNLAINPCCSWGKKNHRKFQHEFPKLIHSDTSFVERYRSIEMVALAATTSNSAVLNV